ncbi:hypothetical protein TU75_20740 [Pseudomonas poae]|nr:hypothetical protein TU75_20740 [Pseudomonas poae]
MGKFAGKLDADALQKLANHPSATRFMDARTRHINVIQEVEGKLIRITVTRDEMKIISVGPIRPNQVKNLLDKGDLSRYLEFSEDLWLQFILRKFKKSCLRKAIKIPCQIKIMGRATF